MTTARCKIVDLNETRYYHCISRCVRGASLCGKGAEHRKQWLEDRLEVLAQSFAVSVAGFSAMSNHLHVLVRIDLEVAEEWSDEEVVRRWMSLSPSGKGKRPDPKKLKKLIEDVAKDSKRVAELRERLANLGWFMKYLKEPLSRMANKEDGCRGAFWEGRYKSIAILDEEALLATCAYIDLNPVAANVTKTPESSPHTSIRQRVEHVRNQGKLEELKSADKGSVAASQALGNVEQDHWLIPLEDRRPFTNAEPASEREGMVEKLTLGNYLLLVDYTGRLYRAGKARISSRIKKIFQRLDTSVTFWGDCLKKMLNAEQLRGVRFSAKGG